jgi:TPR repeat protein
MGEGTPRDDAEAVRLFRLAATAGNAAAQSNLAWLVENGRGTTADRAEAVRLYRLAARQGNEPAIGNLRRLGEREPW